MGRGVADLLDRCGDRGAIVSVGSTDSGSCNLGALGEGVVRVGSGLSGRGYKRVRLRRKTPVHEVFLGILGDQSRPRVWKRLKLGVS